MPAVATNNVESWPMSASLGRLRLEPCRHSPCDGRGSMCGHGWEGNDDWFGGHILRMLFLRPGAVCGRDDRHADGVRRERNRKWNNFHTGNK
jgi:hypothetical protein